MTWREYVLAMEGFANRRSREFEHTRAIVYYGVMVHRDPDRPFPTIEEFWPLRTDDLEGMEDEKQKESARLLDQLKAFKEKNYKR